MQSFQKDILSLDMISQFLIWISTKTYSKKDPYDRHFKMESAILSNLDVTTKLISHVSRFQTLI